MASSLGVTPTSVPTVQDDIDRLHAFRLLIHAEIQNFIDDLAVRLLDVTQDRSSSASLLTHAGHHLLVYYSLEPLRSPGDAARGRYPPFQPGDATSSRAANDAPLMAAIDRHRKRVAKNNGLKASNVRRLLTPLGYREYLFAPGFLDQLDSLGSSRGTVAHASGLSVGAQNWPSGSSEWSRLRHILPGLELLERYAPRLLRPV